MGRTKIFQFCLFSVIFGLILFPIYKMPNLISDSVSEESKEPLDQSSGDQPPSVPEMPIKETLNNDIGKSEVPKVIYTLPNSLGNVPEKVSPMPMPRNANNEPVSNPDKAAEKVSKTTDSGKNLIDPEKKALIVKK